MKILIIRFSSFGDVLLTTPVIRKIKEKYPDSEIDFIVYEGFSEAVSLNPEIRNLILFDRKKSKDKKYVNEVIENLKKEKYDFVIDLHSKILSRIIGKSLSDSKTEYLRYNKRKWWKTLLVKARMITYNADCTIVESYFTALKKLNLYFDRNNIESGKGDALEFYIDKGKEEEFVKKYIEDEKDNFKYIKKVEASEFRVENNYILYGQIDLILEDENEIKIIDFKTGKYNEIEFSSNYRQQLSLYKLLLQKKYDKEIKTYLYYLEEDESKKEILIDDEDLKEDFENINKTVQDILNKKFPKIPYNQNICGLCEFKNYCWGIQ